MSHSLRWMDLVLQTQASWTQVLRHPSVITLAGLLKTTSCLVAATMFSAVATISCLAVPLTSQRLLVQLNLLPCSRLLLSLPPLLLCRPRLRRRLLRRQPLRIRPLPSLMIRGPRAATTCGALVVVPTTSLVEAVVLTTSLARLRLQRRLLLRLPLQPLPQRVRLRNRPPRRPLWMTLLTSLEVAATTSLVEVATICLEVAARTCLPRSTRLSSPSRLRRPLWLRRRLLLRWQLRPSRRSRLL